MEDPRATSDLALQAPQSSLQKTKRRAACDECRSKKLKCTGEQPTCSRCARENITCAYSPQKQMGRPKKRQRLDDEHSEHAHSDAGTNSNASARLGTSIYDIGNFDTAFTPGGSLQPWLQSSGAHEDWNISMPNNLGSRSLPTANSIPSLTPDSSTDSPPTLNLPPELQNISRPHQHMTGTSSTQLLLDPTLTTPGMTDGTNLGLPTSLQPTCACLSTLYLTLSNLQSMDPAFIFPFALHPLREAMQTASDVLACDECPKRFISAIQNTQLIGTLLMSIAERFGKILQAISAEAVRAESAGDEKKFRLADLNTSTSHLHTNGIGCAAAFSINISPSEWRSIAKKVVRAEVYGPSDGNDCCPFFTGLLERMEGRHQYWHNKPMPEDFPRDRRTGELIGGNNIPKEDHVCLKYATYARKLVEEAFDWS